MEQQEQVCWDDVNNLLQHHGFQPVLFADPVENKKLSDLVLLDKKSAGEVRTTLRTMLTDSERRQALIQELVKSNNQLKEEVQDHVTRAVQQSQRVSDLEGLLDEVKTRVQVLEDRCLSRSIQQHSYTQQLQQQKQDAQRKCHLMEQKLSKQEEAAQLQRKLYFTIKEEEKRRARRSQTLQNICKNVSEQNSVAEYQTGPLSRTLREENTAETENISEPAVVCVHYHQLLSDISAVVTNHRSLLRPHRPRTSITGSDPDRPRTSITDFHVLVPTLELWAQQLHLLKHLERRLNKLSGRLLPWQPCDGVQDCGEAVRVEDMMLLVDTMLENTSTDHDKALQSPTWFTLGSMVSHFQKLFDVTSLSGVYPRMNEVYTRLGETTTAMRTLRDVLGLDSRVPAAEVVNQVSTLVSSEKPAGLHGVLGDTDINSVIVKVKQHDEFFSAFHRLTTDILQALGVSQLDDILPALKSLTEPQ
ncbi:centrosomal protein of 70 kDa-like isoform X3 [Embiotoca jacksoni]|uniref:centrosomal protein of 70 kDa-like isoform X3 n=1 Tax=Embiotoca jacksoni TaxID=100190 RepID=UPI003704581B